MIDEQSSSGIIKFLSHPALQGLEALVGLLLVSLPLVALVVRRALGVRKNPEETMATEQQPNPPVSAAVSDTQESLKKPAGCLGILAGYALLAAAIFAMAALIGIFSQMLLGVSAVEEALEAAFRQQSAVTDDSLDAVLSLIQLANGVNFILTLVMFYRGRIARGIGYYIWSTMTLFSVTCIGLGIACQAPLWLVALGVGTFLLVATIVIALMRLTALAWKYASS